MTQKKVLITGAAGFIGRNTASEFVKNGWQVIGLGHGEWPQWRDFGLTAWHNVDVGIDTLLKHAGKPDVIIHCAGGASVGSSVNQPGIDFDLTVRTTSNILEFIRIHSPSTRLIYPSSAAVYGQVSILPITEDAKLYPISPYGLHKKMAEDLCQLYAQQFGLSVTIMRLFSIYGPGLRKQLLWDACKKFEQKESIFLGTGEEIRDWLHVDDVTKLLFLVALKKTTGCSIINVGSGQGVSVKEILNSICDQLGLNVSSTFTSQPKAGDPNAYIADISKALEFGWTPSIDWQDGIAEYVSWFKKCQ